MGKYVYFVNKGEEIVFRRENDLNWYKGTVDDYRIDIFNPQLSNINLTNIVALSQKGDKLYNSDIKGVEKNFKEVTNSNIDEFYGESYEEHSERWSKFRLENSFVEINSEVDLSNITIDFLDLGKLHLTYDPISEEDAQLKGLNYTHYGAYRMSIREMIDYRENGGTDSKILEFLAKVNSALNKISTNSLTTDFFDIVDEKSISPDILSPSTEVLVLKDNKPVKMRVLKAFVDIGSLETDKHFYRSIASRHGITYGLVKGDEYIELPGEEVFKNQTEMFNYLKTLLKEL